MLKTTTKTPKTTVLIWTGSPCFRWSKTYQGKRYKVTCDQLGAPRDEALSHAAALEWFKKIVEQHHQPFTIAEKHYQPAKNKIGPTDRLRNFILESFPVLTLQDVLADLQDLADELSTIDSLQEITVGEYLGWIKPAK